MKKIIIDLDETLTLGKEGDYALCRPNLDVVNRLRELKSEGFVIAIHTSRNMNSYNNSNGLIVANTVPIIIKWLETHKIPYDELWPSKPWCGEGGFYVDDKAIRPQEFAELSLEEIYSLIGRRNRLNKS